MESHYFWLALELNETSTVTKPFLIFITGSSGCVYLPLMEIFEGDDICLSVLLNAGRYQDWLIILRHCQHISTPGQPHPERSDWGQHNEEWEPSDHLYLLLWQLRKSLMLTMLILASSVCPHCYIVWSPNGSRLACDWLNLTVKGCIISSFRLLLQSCVSK